MKTLLKFFFVSACMKAPGPREEVYEESTQGKGTCGYNSVAMFIRLAVVASQIHEIPYSSRSSKVIDLGFNRKRTCNLLYIILIINSNFGRISCHFRDIDIIH